MTTSKEPSPEVKIATGGCCGCLGFIVLIVIIGGIVAIIDACSSDNGDLLWPDESDTETWEYQNQLIRKCIQGEKARGALATEEEKFLRQILAKKNPGDPQRLLLGLQCIDLGYY